MCSTSGRMLGGAVAKVQAQQPAQPQARPLMAPRPMQRRGAFAGTADVYRNAQPGARR